jgi:cobaltochelatase CobN
VIAFISAVDTDLTAARAGGARLPAEFPGVTVLAARDLPDEEAVRRALEGVRIAVVRILGGRPYFTHGFDALASLAASGELEVIAIAGDAHADPDLDAHSTVRLEVARTAHAYGFAGGAANLEHLFRYVADTGLGTAFGYDPPRETAEWGFYHPAAADPAACARLDREAFAREHWRARSGVAGIVFYRADWASGNLAHVDALIHACEALDLDVLPVFVYSLRDCERVDDLPLPYARAFMRAGVACVDVVISLLSYATSDLAQDERMTRSVGAALRADVALDVPLLQGVTTMQSREEWAASERGLAPLDAATKVVMPEFDGKIGGPVFAFRDAVTTLARADAGQTANLARLAARYARLRRTPNREKRIAIVLTNFANRQGRIGGAVGLDTPASVIAILRALDADGYDVGTIPPDGQALIEALLARGGYDIDTLTAEQLAYAEARYHSLDYARWHERFPVRVRRELESAWGEPPGAAYRVGEEIYVAGLRCGNVFVMIQPPRGFGGDPLGVYHSGDLVPTHQYLGAYRWLRDVFRADAIVHCGKHGTLEWLPGKALGLSDACYPMLALGEIPLFYPFIVNDPGEGAQAKRRAHACIIDHLVPPMTKAETYDELARLQRLLSEYAAAERIDPDKLPLIAEAIWTSVLAADLQRDLGVEAVPGEHEMSEFLQHVDGYLCEIGDLQIRDGLHVLGSPPAGTQLVDLSLAIMRLDGPEALGLAHALCDDLEIRYEAIADPSAAGVAYAPPVPPALRAFFEPDVEQRAVLVRDVRAALDRIAREVVTALLLDGARDPAALALRCGVSAQGAFVRSLRVLVERVVPAIRRATDEIDHLLGGLRGRHVPPGPSGAPTRGVMNALPTGRNFYTVDVRAIPTRFAWSVGVRLGDALLAAALTRDGAYPRSIGITVWGTANMRTQGDDVAEILWLLGVRPVWNEENGRVVDVAVIPLAELGRPRIDVTVRISGMFRDAFPAVVALIDRAVALVADLAEDDDENFVRAAVRREELVRIDAGSDAVDARRRARFRIFGSRPGAYGTGVLAALEAGRWHDAGDLADAYLEAGGFAYGAASYGEPAPAEFRARLAASTIAVQNQDNREHDIFDSDDYLQFHGGMVAAMRRLRGTAPSAFFGDSSDPHMPRTRGLDEEARRVFRARVVNPKWIAGARRHGYKGALEMAATVDYLFGYDATANVVGDWMYERVAGAYILDPENRAFLERANPWSAREMTERLLEAVERGMWAEPRPETLTRLREGLLDLEGALEDRMEPADVR